MFGHPVRHALMKKTTERYTVHWWNGIKDLEIYQSKIQLWGCKGVNKMQTLFACYHDSVAIFLCLIQQRLKQEPKA